jgi:hypothetical protein
VDLHAPLTGDVTVVDEWLIGSFDYLFLEFLQPSRLGTQRPILTSPKCETMWRKVLFGESNCWDGMVPVGNHHIALLTMRMPTSDALLIRNWHHFPGLDFIKP